jgi:hypothetical protein
LARLRHHHHKSTTAKASTTPRPPRATGATTPTSRTTRPTTTGATTSAFRATTTRGSTTPAAPLTIPFTAATTTPFQGPHLAYQFLHLFLGDLAVLVCVHAVKKALKALVFHFIFGDFAIFIGIQSLQFFNQLGGIERTATRCPSAAPLRWLGQNLARY